VVVNSLRAIVLDSTPLGLIVNRPGFAPADECRAWLKKHLESGVRVHVPSIIVYELRRELLRIASAASLRLLDQFIHAEPDRYVSLTDEHLEKAAELWAAARKQGVPTADPSALDIDVILSAQSLSLKLHADEYVVATNNVGHLARFVSARTWKDIQHDLL
jgi:predicted nucleic acid-binding protein